jgi:hypothetical protein
VAASARVVGATSARWRLAVAPVVVSRGNERSAAGGLAEIAEIAVIRKSPMKWASNAGLDGAAANRTNRRNSRCADGNTEIVNERGLPKKSPRLADRRSTPRGMEQVRQSKGWSPSGRYNSTSKWSRAWSLGQHEKRLAVTAERSGTIPFVAWSPPLLGARHSVALFLGLQHGMSGTECRAPSNEERQQASGNCGNAPIGKSLEASASDGRPCLPAPTAPIAGMSPRAAERASSAVISRLTSCLTSRNARSARRPPRRSP